MMFNAFREKVSFFLAFSIKCLKKNDFQVQLKAAPLLSPFVCFRVVTKGNFPLLVKVFSCISRLKKLWRSSCYLRLNIRVLGKLIDLQRHINDKLAKMKEESTR